MPPSILRKPPGYREVKAFDGPNLGYFCCTCDAFQRTDLTAPPGTGKVGRCDRVAPAARVKSFGVCNLWVAADQIDWTLSNGVG